MTTDRSNDLAGPQSANRQWATRDAFFVVVLNMEAEVRAFVAAQGDQLRRTAYLLCRDWHAADDLVSITLTKLFRHWRRVSAADNPAAYARGVLTNAWLDERRRPGHREDPFDVLPDQPDAQIHVDASAVEDRQDLMDLLQCLPAGRRAVVVLRYYCDLSVEQTADLLGITTGTVKSQAAKGLTALRAVKEEA
jgi:RNA polymerase sigma-70 factor (sigma-E family)